MRERVGSYRILRRLGGGGMGEVFEAVDDRLERRVAVKLLHAQLSAHPEVAARFANEARAVNIVRHPGLVDVYELGRLDDGGHYIVMELLVGETLSARLRRQGALGCEAAVRVGRQIAGALAAAHAAGIVHRDLKPDNIMLVADDEIEGGERVKVLDFGIAKMLSDGHTPVGNRTHTGLILGTPQYMAPEQCKGGGDVDGRADVYALGLVLYETLTGAPPFSAANEWELFMLHMSRVPAPLPSTVKPALANLVARMLDKQREARPMMADIAARLAELRGASGGSIAVSQRETVAAAMPAPPAMPVTVATAPAMVSARAATARHHPSLHSVAGEQRPRPRAGASIGWAVGALSIALVAAGAWGLHARAQQEAAAPAVETAAAIPPTAPPPPPPPSESKPPPAPLVRWTITSLPSGATIERTDTDEPLGDTPWHREQPPATGTLRVRLTLPGHRARELVLRRDLDEHHQVRLPPARRHDSEDDDVQTVH